ncbi:hypothetical protein [Frateuria soli]|uniref:hypothetical protein n=1 Tax=Frateuria soli TaxID=1542730 RepID=UPI001E649737|nr:hypothetical protein [Frateuria soli]UGB39723.1 hypothetical protein LQ771_07810 [Frateuria soli]
MTSQKFRTVEISDSEAVQKCLEILEAAARVSNFSITPDGRVSESDAAALLGVAPLTLRNWRLATAAIPWHRIGGPAGRVTYRLADLAAHIEAARESR